MLLHLTNRYAISKEYNVFEFNMSTCHIMLVLYCVIYLKAVHRKTENPTVFYVSFGCLAAFNENKVFIRYFTRSYRTWGNKKLKTITLFDVVMKV